jgi:hypothetical protein
MTWPRAEVVAAFFERKQRLLVAVLLSLFYLQGIFSLATESITYDAPKHYTTGLIFLESGFCCNGTDNTPLTAANAIGGLVGARILGVSKTSPEALFCARLPTLLFGVLLGLLVFRFTKRRFGLHPALFSLFLFAFSPDMLCHSGLLAQDLPAACTILLAAWCFAEYLERPSLRTALLSGASLGLALISKLSALLLLPIFLLMFLLLLPRLKKPFTLLLGTAGILGLSLLLLNAAYLFHGTLASLGTDFSSDLFRGLTEHRWFADLRVPLPRSYVEGLDLVAYNTRNGWPAYFWGQYSNTGWRTYFLACLLLKTPIPILIFSLAGVALVIWHRRPQEMILLVPVLFFFLYNTFFNHMNIGLRHILMIYPFLFVLSGAVLRYAPRLKQLAPLFMLWLVAAAATVFPHYCEYFNEFVGGPKNGYKVLVDSNLDWGQDDYFIGRYIRERDEPVLLNPGCRYTEGIVAVDVNRYLGIDGDRGECYAWLKGYPLIDRVAYTWLIFDTRNRSVDRRSENPPRGGEVP